MRRLITFLLAIGFFTIVLPVLAAGPDIGLGAGGLTQKVAGNGGYAVAGVTDTSLSASIGQVIKVALSLVGTIFFALTVYAGFLWMTASGNEEKVTKATEILKRAIIGLIIVLAAYSITSFVLGRIIQSANAGPAS